VIDQLQSNYLLLLSTYKWWLIFFCFVVDQSIINFYAHFAIKMEKLGFPQRTISGWNGHCRPSIGTMLVVDIVGCMCRFVSTWNRLGGQVVAWGVFSWVFVLFLLCSKSYLTLWQCTCNNNCQTSVSISWKRKKCWEAETIE